MKLSTAALLLGLGVVVATGGWYFGRSPNEAPPASTASQPIFPGLGDHLGEAAKVVIRHGDATLEFDRAGAGWTIAQRGGYPALADKLHALFVSLAELRLLEPRTDNPELYSRLGLEDPAKPGAASTLVWVLDAQGKSIADIVLGNARKPAEGAAAGPAQGDQLYVRRPGDKQAWLAEGHVGASTDVMEWMIRDLTNINRDRITAATVTHGAEALEFARQDGKFVLTAPADHPALDDAKVADVARGYEYLALTDVEPRAQMQGEALGHSVFHTDDGLALEADLVKSGDDIWAGFKATGSDKSADEANRLSAIFDGWAYKIGNWKISSLVPTLDALKAAEPKKPDAEPSH